MSEKNCCYGCPKRTMTCHSTCKDYFKLQKQNEEKAKTIRKAKEKDKIMDAYVCRQKAMSLKGFRRDGKGNKI